MNRPNASARGRRLGALRQLLGGALLLGAVALGGCERETDSKSQSETAHAQQADGDHAHHDHNHDHAHEPGDAAKPGDGDASCGNGSAGAAHKSADSHAHSHDVKPQRGGLVIPLGDHLAHAEITVEKPTGRITLYVMDCDARAIRLAQEEILIKFRPPAPEPDFELPLLPVEDALTGEKKGDTSAYSIRCDELQRLTNFDATITRIKIKGVEVKDVAFTYPAPKR